MPLLYNEIPLVPAPLVTITKQSETASDGTYLGQTYQITLEGNLIAVPPGTTPIDADARLGVLLTKQKLLSDLFSESGKILEIYSPDGTGVTKCNPKVVSINFTQGIWYDRTEYSITLEAPSLYGEELDDSFNVTDIRDQWQIEESGSTPNPVTGNMEPVWQLSHSVSAKGKLVYDENGLIDDEKRPWKLAREWVLNKLLTSNFNTKPFDTKEELNLTDGGSGYNHKRTEEVDVIDGTFSITEQWILALGLPATEDITISVRRTPEESIPTVVTISGTVKGLSVGLNKIDDRMTNAITYFNSNVKPNLLSRAQGAASDTTISEYGVTGSLDYNYAEGTISYNYDFSDRSSPANNDTVYDTYVVSRKTSIDEVETTVTVQGTITGRLKVSEPPSIILKYERAKTYWDALSGGNNLLERANTSGVPGLKPSALQGSVDFNFYEGTITYTYDFDNRVNDTVKNDYTVSMRTTIEDGRTTVTVEGTIIGLRQHDDDPVNIKYLNALDFWSTWVFQIPNEAAQYVPGVELNTSPISTSRGDNKRQGTITYSYEYNTGPTPTIPGALTQQITINDDHPSDVFASITVLGRPAGPILQDIGSKTAKRKSVNLEVVMKPGFEKPNTDNFMNNYRPDGSQVFLETDQESWTEVVNRYTRTMTWVYE